MIELVTRCVEENEVKWLGEFPRELMSDHEAKVVNFIIEYVSKYDRTPSVRRLSDEFDAFVPYIFTPSAWESTPPPLGDVFERSIRERLFDQSERLLVEARTVMERDKEVPLDLIEEIQRLHALSLGVHRYSSFDRDLYFRRKAMSIPFRVINKRIRGLGNGDFLLLVGRLGTGKSTVAQWMAKHAWQEEKRVLFVSAEMLAVDVFSRLDAMMGKFNPLILRDSKTDTVKEMLDGIKSRISEGAGDIIIPRARVISPQQIAGLAKHLSIDLIVVDGAYLLQPSLGHFTSKWEKVATVSNELKQMALDLQVPLIGTAQIKRGASGADGYDPEDIALSDALGQDADFVVAIYQNKIMPERAELQLIKNRYGSVCATQIHVDFDTMTIVDETVEGAVGATDTPIAAKEWAGRD